MTGLLFLVSIPNNQEGTITDITFESLYKDIDPSQVPGKVLAEKIFDALRQCDISNLCSYTTDTHIEVTFPVRDVAESERITILLKETFQIGKIEKSRLITVPMTYAILPSNKKKLNNLEEGDQLELKSSKRSSILNEKEEEDHTLDVFKKSIRSRLLVAQVVQRVRTDALFTFDYCAFCILASIIAFMGLFENSSLILVASMLVSPLMGPILAAVFGVVILDHDLRWLGTKSELFGLSICILSGFVYGMIGSVCTEYFSISDSYPTWEMSTRGQWRGLITGLLIALPSGAGVALSVLGGNVGSLVGVAISASLLPPAVNAGALWAHAFVTYIFHLIRQFYQLSNIPNERMSEMNEGNFSNFNQTLWNETIINNVTNERINCDRHHIYFCDETHDCLLQGLISLLLTILNILCIFLVAILVLKIKEVAPKNKNFFPIPSLADFFHIDLKNVRDFRRTYKGKEAENLSRQILKDYARIKEGEHVDIDNISKDAKFNLVQGISSALETIRADNVYKTVSRLAHFRDDGIDNLQEDFRNLTNEDLGSGLPYIVHDRFEVTPINRSCYNSINSNDPLKNVSEKELLVNQEESKHLLETTTDNKGKQKKEDRNGKEEKSEKALEELLHQTSGEGDYSIKPGTRFAVRRVNDKKV
ncbi:hypothetical protein SNEBB_003219 [Seison nebaliae]|nr:hypothetical protein SNEBB_003219 [Seison nebaliae]